MTNIKFISYTPDWAQYGWLSGELHVPGFSVIHYEFYDQEQLEIPSSLKDVFVTSEGEIFEVYSQYVVLNPFNESQAFKYFTILGFSNVQFEYRPMEDYLKDFQC